MNVLINFGRHLGEVRDVAPEAALAMLKDGRASRPNEEGESLSVDQVRNLFKVPPELTGEVLRRAFAPEEIAPFVAVKPEEAIELQPRRRSRR